MPDVMTHIQHRLTVLAHAALLVLICSSKVHAQGAPLAGRPMLYESLPAQQDSALATESELYFAGFLGAVVGFGVGAAAGYGLELTASRSCVDWCGVGGALIGMFVGESLGLALGTHLTNDRKGPVLATSAASIGIAAIGLAIATRLDSPRIRTPVLLAIPITQLLTVAGMEYRAQNRPSER
jgi:hypothetical protein